MFHTKILFHPCTQSHLPLLNLNICNYYLLFCAHDENRIAKLRPYSGRARVRRALLSAQMPVSINQTALRANSIIRARPVDTNKFQAEVATKNSKISCNPILMGVVVERAVRSLRPGEDYRSTRRLRRRKNHTIAHQIDRLAAAAIKALGAEVTHLLRQTK